MGKSPPSSGHGQDKAANPTVLNRLLKKLERGRAKWLPKPRSPQRFTADPEPKISIIIPIWGTEEYVEKCVRSAMEQTLSRIEIICVDDASPDRSAAIVEGLAREDGRIRLIRHNRNLGLGGARNTGIAAARAPYVTGVDSDDYILPDMMERLWEASDAGIADIVACGFARFNDDGTAPGPSYLPEPGSFFNDSHQLDIFEFLNPSFCNKIWRKSLFTENNIVFPENLYFEDLAVMPQLLCFAKYVRVIPGAYYQYRARVGSITNSHSFKHLIDHFKIFDILDNFLVREGLAQRYRSNFIGRICRSMSFYASKIVSSDMDKSEKEQYLRFSLMLQVGYVEYKDRLRDARATTLQALIGQAQSSDALDCRLSP